MNWPLLVFSLSTITVCEVSRLFENRYARAAFQFLGYFSTFSLYQAVGGCQ